MNCSIGLSHFEVVPNYKSRRPLDFISMSPNANVSMLTGAFVHYLHDLHIEINKQHEAGNALYRLQADPHKWYFKFNIRDYVILQACSADIFKILKHVDPNAHVIAFSSHFGYHPSLNIEDFITYIHHFTSFDDPFLLSFVDPQLDYVDISTLIPSTIAHKDKIDVVLDERDVLTNDDDIQYFLVCWVILPGLNCTWIPRERCQLIWIKLLLEFWYLVHQKDCPPWHDLKYLEFRIDCNLNDLSTRQG